MSTAPLRPRTPAECIDEVLERLGRRLVVGTPLGIGKPNALLNELYRRARSDPGISLDIVTALSLNPPEGHSELERRFLAPIVARVWGDYPRLEYASDRDRGTLPANVHVLEFYMRSGALLHSPSAQIDYISSNYSHVTRDLLGRGVNLILQSVSTSETRPGKFSLSSNPDVTLDLAPKMKASSRSSMVVLQVNRQLPYFGGPAEVDASWADVVLDDPALDHAPFAVPHEPVDAAGWAIGLHASRWIVDGGTLQVGIGALGDAVCHSLRVRHRDPGRYCALLAALTPERDRSSSDSHFQEGLYVASELISDSLFALLEEGIVKRRVRDGVTDPGTVLEGAFFLGPAAFYETLCALPDEQRELIQMTSVGEVNRIYPQFPREKRQRSKARFINMTMKATLLGAAVSDQLAGGAVVSGVGGQSDFVQMAHQLPDARSVLLFRATHVRDGKAESNVVFEYPHATIPRHMRDLFVTEYGCADLRGKTDAECAAAMIEIADSRFQDELIAQAKRRHKLPSSYRLPERCRANHPQRIARALAASQTDETLPELPFGSDLLPSELSLAKRLKKLAAAGKTMEGRAALAKALLSRTAKDASDEVQRALLHMRLDRPRGAKEHLLAALVRAAHELE